MCTAVSSEAWAKLRVWARVAGGGRLLLSGSVAHASLKTAVFCVQGNTPAMEAAMRCNREALLALMQPFLVFPNGDELDRLLHHRNAEGQNLLAYVSHHNKV